MDLTEYRALVAKVDAFFQRVRERYPVEMTCHSGCDGCCHVQLTVSEVEAESIRQHLREKGSDPFSRRNDGACVALDEAGRCRIYEARPLICRTQGLPMKAQKRSLPVLDVCPLNFEGKPLDALEADCVLDVQTIDTLLGVVNARLCATEKRTRIEDVLFSAHEV